MAFVTVEIDIAADGSIRATPNPVRVRSGQTLFFHIRANASEATRFSINFPGGPRSPFGAVNSTVEVAAQRCLGGGSHVNWPAGVRRATVTASAHGSPVLGTVDIEVLIDDTIDVLAAPGAPQIVQHYYLGGAAPSTAPVSVAPALQPPSFAPTGGDDAGGVALKSTDCGPAAASAGPIWGPWDRDEAAAIGKALTRVRGACKAQCGGKCSSKSCNYLELKSSVDDIEERTRERQKEYRAKASSSGKCQCE